MVAQVHNVTPGGCSQCKAKDVDLYVVEWRAGAGPWVRPADDTLVGTCVSCIEKVGMFLYSWAGTQRYVADHSGARPAGQRRR